MLVAKDLRSAQNGTIIGSVLKMMVPLIVTIPGLLGLAVLLNSNGSPMVLLPESDPRAGITHRTFNDVLPLLMGQYLGPGLLGLGVTAMVAGFMSGMAGNVSAFATVWTHDVYKPLIRKHASDAHYLAMGRWSSIFGVLASIATAYALFYFSNILEYLQVLVFFFIVPLFGTVIMGMLWKRATKAAGFWGFLIAILASIGMWVYVHTFPEGYRPAPRVVIGQGSVVRVEKTGSGNAEVITVILESGTIDAINVPIPPAIAAGHAAVTFALPASCEVQGHSVPVQILARDVVMGGTGGHDQFGAEGVKVLVRRGVGITTADVTQHFVPAVFNPAHARVVARSEKAQGMAINMYTGFWVLVISVLANFIISLFTRPKPDVELKNLVYGLTPLPSAAKTRLWQRPIFWAGIVAALLIAVNILFW